MDWSTIVSVSEEKKSLKKAIRYVLNHRLSGMDSPSGLWFVPLSISDFGTLIVVVEITVCSYNIPARQ